MSSAATHPSAEPIEEDTEQLRILSIFHFVIAGLMAMLGSVPIIHLVIGLSLLTNAQDMGAVDGGPPMTMAMTMIALMATRWQRSAIGATRPHANSSPSAVRDSTAFLCSRGTGSKSRAEARGRKGTRSC